MTKFIEVKPRGSGPVTINVNNIAVIASAEGGTLIYLTAQYPGNNTISYQLDKEYSTFMHWFYQQVQ